MKKQKNTWSTIKGVLLGVVGLCAVTAVGAFAVQAMPIQTTPNTPTTNTPQTPVESRIKLVTSNIDDTFLKNVDVVCLDSSGKEVDSMNFGETYTIKFVPLNGATIVSAMDNNWNDITGVNSFTFTPTTYNDQWLMCDVQTDKDKIKHLNVQGGGFSYEITNTAGQAVTELIPGETYYFNPTFNDGVSMTGFMFNSNAVENPTFPYEFVASRDFYIWLQTDAPSLNGSVSVNRHACAADDCNICSRVDITITNANGVSVEDVGMGDYYLTAGETYTIDVDCVDGTSVFAATYNQSTSTNEAVDITFPYTFTADEYQNNFSIDLNTFSYGYSSAGCELLFYDENGVLADKSSLVAGATYNVEVVLEDGYVNTDWTTKSVVADLDLWLRPSVEPVSIVPEFPENITATITPLEDWTTFSALKYGSGYKFEFVSTDGREIKQVLLNGYDLPLGKFVWFDFIEANFEFVYAE